MLINDLNAVMTTCTPVFVANVIYLSLNPSHHINDIKSSTLCQNSPLGDQHIPLIKFIYVNGLTVEPFFWSMYSSVYIPLNFEFVKGVLPFFFC